MKVKMEADYIKQDAELKRIVAHRQLMQSKLKQVSLKTFLEQKNLILCWFQLYIKRTRQNNYRDPYDHNSTESTNSNSILSTPSCSNQSSNVNI